MADVRLKRFVTLDEVVSEAMTIVPNADTMDRLIAKQWVYRAVRQIGPNINWITSCNVPVKNLVIKKPSDMFRPIDIGLYTANGEEVLYAYRGQDPRIHAKEEAVSVLEDLYSPPVRFPIDLSEDGDCFHLSSNATGLVSYATIKYLKLPIDEQGELIIPEDQVLAIILFIKYMWSMRNNENRLTIAANRADWLAEKREAVSTAKLPHQMQMDEIARKWNSMILDMRSIKNW